MYGRKGAAPARNKRGSEPSQGLIRDPNSGVRLFFSIDYRNRLGFSLFGRLALIDRFSKARECLAQRIVANVEQGSGLNVEGCLVYLHDGGTLGFGLHMII